MASVAGALLALVVAAGAQEREAPRGGSDACAPVRADASTLPDLQQGAEALCRALFGDAEGGPFAERLRLRIGGWADASYQGADLGDDEHSVAINHANLHLDARLDERWQLFFEGEWEHEPDLTGGRDEREWEVEQLYGEYRHSDALRVRVGRFATPFGYWTPLHWSILVDTIEDPIHESLRIVPEQQIGAQLHGRLFADELLGLESELAWSLHGGYASEGFAAGNADGATLGVDLNARLAARALLGVSLYTQENDDEGDRREDDLVVYGELRLPFDLVARSEYVRQRRDSDTRPGLVRDADIVYAKLRWDFRDDAYLNYRFEFGEDDRFGATADHAVHRATLGCRPISRVHLKAEYARHLWARPFADYDFWGVSAGVFF